ncbi:MAG: type II secretion system protein, partial [Luteolibacter sp.]
MLTPQPRGTAGGDAGRCLTHGSHGRQDACLCVLRDWQEAASCPLVNNPQDHHFRLNTSHRPPLIPANRAAGFTLVELLVTITIVVVLAGLIFTASSRAISKAKESDAIQD